MVSDPANHTSEIKVYGIPAETGRWVFVLAGMVMNLCLGTVYAWSVFRKPLQDFFSTSEVKITATQTLLPFVMFLAIFTVLMPISGRLLQRGISPRVLSIIGSLFVAAGWILSGYVSDINYPDAGGASSSEAVPGRHTGGGTSCQHDSRVRYAASGS